MQKNDPLISVIIPVYNVEKYLRRCIDSVLAQSYSNLEIILINDGSTDSSLSICEEYESSDARVKVLTKVNGGQSTARNVGLEYASGEFIGFIDSDDWISPSMYQTLYDLIRDNHAEASEIGFIMASDFGFTPDRINSNMKVLTGKNDILKYYLDSATRKSGEYSVWRCLFPAKIACKYRFREGKVNEDIDYKYKVLRDCRSFVVSDKIEYYYFQSGDSTSTGVLKSRDFDLYEAADELCRLTSEEVDSTIQFLGKVKKARTPFSLLSRIAYYGIGDNIENPNDIIRRLTQEHRRNLPILLKAPLPMSRKLLAIGFALNFRLVEFPMKILRK